MPLKMKIVIINLFYKALTLYFDLVVFLIYVFSLKLLDPLPLAHFVKKISMKQACCKFDV